MKTIFIGGSRDISRLPHEVKERLDNVIASGHRVVVGDANGADKAVQKHLSDAHYRNVTVFFSGTSPRNNVGDWKGNAIVVESKTKDYQFHAAKDREMAHLADFALMVWDGKSPGTLLNLVRIMREGKIAVLYHFPQKEVINFKSADQLRAFVKGCENDVRKDIEKRATADEKAFIAGEPQQSSMLDAGLSSEITPLLANTSLATLNEALATGNMTRIVEAVGLLARSYGMSDVARDTGLSRESLYRSLDATGNPEFATVMKVLSSLGVMLEARPSHDDASRS